MDLSVPYLNSLFRKKKILRKGRFTFDTLQMYYKVFKMQGSFDKLPLTFKVKLKLL